MTRLLLLGPTDLRSGEQSLPLGAPRQRAVVAMLALARGRVVPVSALIDGVWGEDPPPTVTNAIQVYVAGARKCLAAAGLESALLTQRPGYRLFLPDDALDVTEAERAVAEGEHALERGRRAAGAACLRRALDLWRGDPLDDVQEYPFAAAERVRLGELRRRALDAWADVELDLGSPEALLPHLESDVRQHRFHEPGWALLARAYYAVGRQHDALATLRRLRRLLRDELGTDPGPAVLELEELLLRQDPQLVVRRKEDFAHAATHVAGSPTITGVLGVPEPVDLGVLVLPDGRTVALKAGDNVIGRQEGCDVVLSHRDVSRRHAVARADGSGLIVVRDLGSTNGTVIGGVRLVPDDDEGGGRPVRPGDRFEVGPMTLRFEATPPA